MYRVVGLLQSATDFDLDLAAARLAARLPAHAVSRTGDSVTLRKGDWEMYVAVASGPDVQTETVGLVDKLAGVEPAEAEAFAATDRRVEAWTDTPDPFMEHFDDYLGVVEVLKSFRGLLAVDPKEPGVL
jgi:hypothetical protein